MLRLAGIFAKFDLKLQNFQTKPCRYPRTWATQASHLATVVAGNEEKMSSHRRRFLRKPQPYGNESASQGESWD